MSKKVTLTITETLTYSREAIVEIPDNVTEGEFNKLLNRVEMQAQSAEDVPFIIKELLDGVEVVENVDMSLDSPNNVEVEIEEFDME